MRVGNRVGVADVRMFNVDAEAVTIATAKGVYNITIKKDYDLEKNHDARSKDP